MDSRANESHAEPVEDDFDPLGREARGRGPFSLTTDTCMVRRRGLRRRRSLLHRRLRQNHRRPFR